MKLVLALLLLAAVCVTAQIGPIIIPPGMVIAERPRGGGWITIRPPHIKPAHLKPHLIATTTTLRPIIRRPHKKHHNRGRIVTDRRWRGWPNTRRPRTHVKPRRPIGRPRVPHLKSRG